jgi:hypothetical protein
MFPTLIFLSRFKMQYKHILATLAVVLFSAIIALIILLGLTSVTELFIAIISALVLAILGTAWWGFRDKIEEKQKFAFYSPIHAMIVRVNSNISHERASEWTLGKWVNVRLFKIDYPRVTEAFTQYSTKFKDEDLKMWAEIEEEIESAVNGGGFYLTNDRLKWFDDLEARYNS